MATVATGTPFGICTIDSSESRPCNAVVLTGTPITALQGLDSLLSIVQMPKGVPVATVAIDGGRNAGLLAAQILALADPDLAARLRATRETQQNAAREADVRVRGAG